QPLHVGAQYFDSDGKPTDPDASGVGFATEGGNNLHLILDQLNDHGRSGDSYVLHTYWDDNAVTTALDQVRKDIQADRNSTAAKIKDADIPRFLAAAPPKDWKRPADVPFEKWTEAWADQTLGLARQAYDRLEYRDVKLDAKRKSATAVVTEKAQKAGEPNYHDWAGMV